MKTSKIKRNMLVTALAVSSLLLLTGYTFVVAQSVDDVEDSPLFTIRTAMVTNSEKIVDVSYINQETTLSDVSSQGNVAENQIIMYTFYGWGTCAAGCVGPPTPMTLTNFNCPSPYSTYGSPINCIGPPTPTPQPPPPPPETRNPISCAPGGVTCFGFMVCPVS